MDSTNSLLRANNDEISAIRNSSRDLDYDAVSVYAMSTIDDA